MVEIRCGLWTIGRELSWILQKTIFKPLLLFISLNLLLGIQSGKISKMKMWKCLRWTMALRCSIFTVKDERSLCIQQQRNCWIAGGTCNRKPRSQWENLCGVDKMAITHHWIPEEKYRPVQIEYPLSGMFGILLDSFKLQTSWLYTNYHKRVSTQNSFEPLYIL